MIIWAVLVVAIGAVCLYKSKQLPMTKGEQFYELACVAQREHSFLSTKIEHKPYNGVE